MSQVSLPQVLGVCLHGNRNFPIGMPLVLPSAVNELLSLHRAEFNEFIEFFQLRFEQFITSAQHVINMKANSTTQRTCW